MTEKQRESSKREKMKMRKEDYSSNNKKEIIKRWWKKESKQFSKFIFLEEEINSIIRSAITSPYMLWSSPVYTDEKSCVRCFFLSPSSSSSSSSFLVVHVALPIWTCCFRFERVSLPKWINIIYSIHRRQWQ